MPIWNAIKGICGGVASTVTVSMLVSVHFLASHLEVEHASKLYSDRFRMSMQKTRSPILDEIREFTKVWTLLQHITFFTSWPPALLKDCWPL